MDSAELDDVLDVLDVLDVESVEFDDVPLADVVPDVLLLEFTPSDSSADAMAAASASMGDEPDELEVLSADSSASLDVELLLVLCVLEVWPDAQIEYREFESVNALIDM